MNDIKEIIRQGIVYLITLEARAVVLKYKPKIVMVTGSVGKTSSKDAVYTALSGNVSVRRSEKSFNSDIGVPLTVLGVPNGWGNPLIWFRNLIDGLVLLLVSAPYPKWLVLEVGADRPGDITKSLRWLKPDMVVATRFPDVPVHVEFYKNPDEVVEEELAPLSWLGSGGVAVVNQDDARASAVQFPEGVTRVSFGTGMDADVRGTRYMVTSRNKVATGVAFDVYHGDQKARVTIPNVIGKTHMQAVLAGIASAVGAGISLAQAAAKFAGHRAPSGRTRLIPAKGDALIIDDSYNSSPVAVEEALSILASVPRTGRRIAILGDMLELGPYSVSEHTRMGTIAAASCDMLITSGIRARGIAEGARQAGMQTESVVQCEKAEDAAAILLPLLQKGDVVLVKGSQSMRMERAVRALMAEPEKAKELLVRHDREWLNRA